MTKPTDNYFILSPLVLACMCIRENDGSKNLVLNGEQLHHRIRRRLVDTDIRIICAFLEKNPKVKHLYFAYNNITSKGLKELAEFLQGNENIQSLNLMNNDIDEKGAIRLAKLGNNLNLTTLQLNGNSIGERGGKNLAVLLLKNNKLSHLDLSQSDQTIASLVAIMAVLKHDNKTLEYLNISRVIGQALYHLMHDHVGQVVGQMLRFNTSLKEIHLEKLSLTDHDIELLVNGLMENKTLEVLNLACNQIADYGLECLSNYFDNKPPLKKLLLHHNHIGNTGARAFSFKYPKSQIEFLDISENRLTEKGVLDILNSIRKPYPIQHLFIRGNKFGFETYKVIRRMLLSGVLHKDRIDIKIYKKSEVVNGKITTTYQYAHSACNDHSQPEYYALCVDRKTSISGKMFYRTEVF